uniref:Secreted protein n=1 Tax=Hadrurus spadix TaxID=141984 RepID=A0A1W7R9K9_9SCOR
MITKMRREIVIQAAILFLAVSLTAAYTCSDPSNHIGQWLGINQQCVSLVRHVCSRLEDKHTSTWVPGKLVKDNCDDIPEYTAIATFLKDGGLSYEGHAAIFLSCVPSGIRVIDQYVGKPISIKTIRYGGNPDSYDADNFYTIEVT